MSQYKTWLEISKANLNWNLLQVKKNLNSNTKVLAIVKANAYGHGFEEVVSLLKEKVDWFGVDNIDEALSIRKMMVETSILVLGFVPSERLRDAAENNISVAFYNHEFFKVLNNLSLNKQLKVHVKIETGMNRQGIDQEDLKKFINDFKKFKNLIVLEGIYTHFSDCDDEGFMEYQLKRFDEAVLLFKENGFSNLIKHCSASAGIFSDKKYHFDLVRAGICLYGYWSSERVMEENPDIILKSVLSWKSVVAQIKNIHKDDFVGYSRTWQAKKKTRIAVIPVGYYDGFDRRFSNNGKVLINGKFANVIGRVAMNMFMVDIDNVPDVKVGDEVVLIGKQNKKLIDVDTFANKIGTINHEVLARLNPLLPKLVV